MTRLKTKPWQGTGDFENSGNQDRKVRQSKAFCDNHSSNKAPTGELNPGRCDEYHRLGEGLLRMNFPCDRRGI